MIDYGHGVKLGPIDKTGSNIFREWRNKHEIWKWCRQNQPISEMAHERWIEAQDKDPSIRMFSIIDPVDKDSVGVCGLTSIDEINGHAEFSLYVYPFFCGFGTKALKTLTDYGFGMLRLNHIFGETFDGNPAAKMFENVGYKLEGTRREFYFREGKYIDAHLYSITRNDWRSKLPGWVHSGFLPEDSIPKPEHECP